MREGGLTNQLMATVHPSWGRLTLPPRHGVNWLVNSDCWCSITALSKAWLRVMRHKIVFLLQDMVWDFTVCQCRHNNKKNFLVKTWPFYMKWRCKTKKLSMIFASINQYLHIHVFLNHAELQNWINRRNVALRYQQDMKYKRQSPTCRSRTPGTFTVTTHSHSVA